MSKRTLPAVVTLTLIVVLAGWLGFSRPGNAVQPGQPPFRNPVEQREQMIRELQDIKQLIQQQNDLLRRLQRE